MSDDAAPRRRRRALGLFVVGLCLLVAGLLMFYAFAVSFAGDAPPPRFVQWVGGIGWWAWLPAMLVGGGLILLARKPFSR